MFSNKLYDTLHRQTNLRQKVDNRKTRVFVIISRLRREHLTRSEIFAKLQVL